MNLVSRLEEHGRKLPASKLPSPIHGEAPEAREATHETPAYHHIQASRRPLPKLLPSPPFPLRGRCSGGEHGEGHRQTDGDTTQTTTTTTLRSALHGPGLIRALVSGLRLVQPPCSSRPPCRGTHGEQRRCKQTPHPHPPRYSWRHSSPTLGHPTGHNEGLGAGGRVPREQSREPYGAIPQVSLNYNEYAYQRP